MFLKYFSWETEKKDKRVSCWEKIIKFQIKRAALD